MKRLISLATMLAIAGTVQAGGRLDEFKITQNSSVPGFTDVEVVGIFWDQRCANVNYVVEDFPANPGQPTEIPATVIRQELQTSFNQWNQIPTSYINMNIVAVKALNNGPPTFDFINELSFEASLGGAGALAVSPSVSLQQDTDFVTGDDLDGDGDSDVYDPKAAKRNTCFDIDSDGDIEFPAGSYKAGTILDNDVLFNLNTAWSTKPGGNDNLADIQAVAVHEFGHSHGLSHAGLDEISATDGSGSTMYPFIDIQDEGSEVFQRDLHSDDIAWSSMVYPEGTALSGPAALQRGDRLFALEYALVKGTVSTSGRGVLGASVTAISKDGERTVESFSGTSRLFLDPVGNLFFFDETFGDPGSSIVNGDYVLPVPKGGLFDLNLEALDGSPFAADRVSTTGLLGLLLGQLNFAEEFRGLGSAENSNEIAPGASVPVIAVPLLTRNNIDFSTNIDVTQRNSGPPIFVGTGLAVNALDVIYAERFTNAEILGLLNNGSSLTSALFETTALDGSVTPIYKRAGLFLGKVNADGTAGINLKKPFFAKSNFVGQSFDSAPLYLSQPLLQNAALRAKLKSDPTLDVFVVLEANNEFVTGSSGLPPLLQLEALAPTGRSFFSTNGGPLAPTPNNWAIELRFTQPN